MKLDKDNYYSQDANIEYFSASQIKDFLNCEAMALATINGEYERPKSSSLLVGSYVDAAFEGTLPAFQEAHPEIFNSRTVELKADYKLAEDMIKRASKDKLFLEYMDGDKQTILTGAIEGIPIKCKLDVYKPGERIVDLKTAKDMKSQYKPGEGRLNFADYWNWPLQMAIYQEIEGHKLPCYLAVITKEDPPAIELIQIPQAKLDAELEYVKSKLPRFDAIKKGIVQPHRCEDCAYCRSTKVLTAPIQLEFEGDEDNEY